LPRWLTRSGSVSRCVQSADAADDFESLIMEMTAQGKSPSASLIQLAVTLPVQQDDQSHCRFVDRNWHVRGPSCRYNQGTFQDLQLRRPERITRGNEVNRNLVDERFQPARALLHTGLLGRDMSQDD
jgi:hypothetical protein